MRGSAAWGIRAAASNEAARVSRLVGELLVGLGEKVRAAGPEGVRVLTEEELQRQQLNWFRAGWHEHARASEPPSSGTHTDVHPDSEHFPLPPPRLLRFPQRPPERPPEHPPDDGQSRS